MHVHASLPPAAPLSHEGRPAHGRAPALRAHWNRSRLARAVSSCSVLAAVTVGSGPALGQRHVDLGATGANTGDNWCDAYNAPQTAVQDALAEAAITGEDVWVARGTYTPGTAQTDTFVITDSDFVGGFLGNQHPSGCMSAETSIGDRPEPIHGTRLSGDIDGTAGTSSGDCHHVVTIPGGTTDIDIDGVAFRYGYADAAGTLGGSGGGVLIEPTGSTGILFDECRFRDNFAEDAGGGLHATQAEFGMKFCVFRRNHANESAGEGGGMSLDNVGEVNVFSTLFAGNRGVLGGGLSITDVSDTPSGPVVYNCEFRNNNATQGAAVRVDSTLGGEFGNCTVVANDAFQLPGFGAGEGGGFFVDLNTVGTMAVYNSIVWNNLKEVDSVWITGSSIEGPDAALVTVTYSDVQMLGGTWPGIGNINTDPLFVSPSTNDYNLQPGSPCADSGHDPDGLLGIPGIPPDVLDLDEDGGAVTVLTPYDLVKGNRREKDDPMASDDGVDAGPSPCAVAGGLVCEAIVDMGAHEREGTQ